MEKVNEWIGAFLYRMGFKPTWSTGIHGGLTAGYGKLDGNGYWRFLAWRAVTKYRRQRAMTDPATCRKAKGEPTEDPCPCCGTMDSTHHPDCEPPEVPGVVEDSIPALSRPPLGSAKITRTLMGLQGGTVMLGEALRMIQGEFLRLRNAHPVRASEPPRRKEVHEALVLYAERYRRYEFVAKEPEDIKLASEKLTESQNWFRDLLAGVPVREEPSAEGYTVEDIGEFLRSCKGLTGLEYDVAMKRIRNLRVVRDEGERIEGNTIQVMSIDVAGVTLFVEGPNLEPLDKLVGKVPAVLLLTEGGGDHA